MTLNLTGKPASRIRVDTGDPEAAIYPIVVLVLRREETGDDLSPTKHDSLIETVAAGEPLRKRVRVSQ